MGRWGLNRYRSKRKPNFHTIEKDNSKELKARIKQLEADIKEWELTVDENGVIIEQLSDKIKQLEAENKELRKIWYRSDLDKFEA